MSYITITDRAERELKARMAINPNAVGVRLSITNTGCSGHSYKMEHVFEITDNDDKIEQNGAVLVVSKADSLGLFGMEIDFEDGKMASMFVFNNPNATAQCGCGESFSLPEG